MRSAAAPSYRRPSTPRQRGAVLVEGLIVAVLLTVFLACGLFFHRLYSSKLATLRQARAEAWDAALAGCGGGLRQTLVSVLDPLTLLSNGDQGGLIDSPSFLSDAGRGVGDPPAIEVPMGPVLGNTVFQVQTRRSVSCNDYADQAAGDSNLASLFQAVKDLAVSR